MNLHKVSEEVFVALDPIVRFGGEEIEFLKERARANPRQRARICAHRSNDDAIHEMLISLSAGSYIHPHRHLGKSESFHIVEGEVDVAIFDDAGRIVDVVELGAPGSGRSLYYRLSQSAFHTLLLRSDFLVIHEVTNGPFVREKTVLAPFAPPEDQLDAARAYMASVADRAAQFCRLRRA